MNRLLLLAPRIATNRLWARAGAVPSFHIAPARTRNATDLITGNLLGSYNSASPALAVGPDGVLALPAANAPVIEHDPTTLACLGARIWGVVTNRALRSEEFNSAPWVRFAGISSVSQNSTIAPNGQLVADSIIETSGVNETHTLQQGGITITSGVAVTQSCFMKAEGRAFGIMAFSPNVNFNNQITQAFFNLQTGVASNATNCTAAIQAFPNGWYRCSITATPTASTTNALLNLRSGDVAGSSSYVGDGRTAISLFGAQYQDGPLAPYVPTTTLAASSTADVWDILSLAAGINNLKTLYVRGRTQASGTRGIASLNDNSSSNRLELSTSGTDPKATAVTSGSTVADLNGGTIAANSTFRLAVRFDTDSYALSLNGGAVTTDTSGARAIVDRLFIGRDQAGNYMNGYIEEMAGWARACTDAQVAALAAS